jgi:TolA-binding protein
MEEIRKRGFSVQSAVEQNLTFRFIFILKKGDRNMKRYLLVGFYLLSIATCSLLITSLIYAQEPQQQKELAEDLKAFSEGYSLTLEGKCKEALDKFTELEKKYPESKYLDRVSFWKGWCHTELKNYGKAIKLYNELVEKYPKSAYADDSLFKIGEIYENYQHDYEKAMETYEKLIKLYPLPEDLLQMGNNASSNIIGAQQQKAQIMEQQERRPQEALKNWEQSQELNKKYNPRRSQKKDDYFNQRAQERIDFIKNNSDHDSVPLTKFIEGQVYTKDGKYAEAIKKFEELLKEYPDCSLADNATYEIALCLKKQNEAVKAEEILKKFIETYPKSELIPQAKQIFIQWKKEKEKEKKKPEEKPVK